MMKAMRQRVLSIIAIIFIGIFVICVPQAEATVTYFEDGGTYSIGNNLDTVTVTNSTKVTLLPSGSIDRKLIAFDASEITMLGGSVGTDLFAYGHSKISLSGGTVGSTFWAYGSATLNMSGGSVPVLKLENYSTAIMYGGSVVLGLSVKNNSSLTLKGSNFAINGSPAAYGKYTAADYTNLRLTGTLENGDLLDNNISIYDNANIILAIPEPATLLLFGLGGLVLRRRKA